MVKWILPFIAIYAQAASMAPKFFGAQTVTHKYYQLGYDNNIEGARWTYHKLTRSLINGNVDRTNEFMTDLSVTDGSANPWDYSGSGFDRGHLVPAGDMKLNSSSMHESFYMSNISPQHPSLNRGRWRALENQVRTWTLRKGDMHIFTGPVFLKSYTNINGTHIAIPDGFYKIIYSEKSQQAIAFFMANKKLYGDVLDFKLTIDEVESLSGIDFLAHLPDFLEKRLESRVNLAFWQ